jgi:hypothetical protein
VDHPSYGHSCCAERHRTHRGGSMLLRVPLNAFSGLQTQRFLS